MKYDIYEYQEKIAKLVNRSEHDCYKVIWQWAKEKEITIHMFVALCKEVSRIYPSVAVQTEINDLREKLSRDTANLEFVYLNENLEKAREERDEAREERDQAIEERDQARLSNFL